MIDRNLSFIWDFEIPSKISSAVWKLQTLAILTLVRILVTHWKKAIVNKEILECQEAVVQSWSVKKVFLEKGLQLY